MILHLVNNEKFIDSAYRVFERVAPGQHRWAVINHDQRAPAYIESFQPELLSVQQACGLLNDPFAGIDALAIHYLTREARRVLAALQRPIPVLWIGYGGDYVHLLGDTRALKLPLTAQLLQELHRGKAQQGWLPRVQHTFARLWPPGTAQRLLSNRMAMKTLGPGQPGEPGLLKKVTHFAPVIREEDTALRQRHAWFSAQFMHWNYTRIEKTYRLFDAGLEIDGDDIMLGNSAIPTNNHLDAFEALAPLVAQGRRLFCPLTYGDADYAEAVCDLGRKRFGDAFVPLRDYLPNAQYLRALSSCSIVVMPQLRQQARENILNMLYGGASVFMLDESLLAQNLRRLGLPIRSFSELSELSPGPQLQSAAERQESRRILQAISGEQRNSRQTAGVVEALLQPGL